jgi:hypothetical protein
MDYACQYMRAMKNSNLTSSTYDPAARRLTTSLTGSTDLPTQFSVFDERYGSIVETAVEVPVFSGSAQVTYTLPGPLDHIVVTPVSARVPTGGRQQFTAQGYDADGVPIAGLPYSWSASAGGTVDAAGLFTAGLSAGTFTNNVAASCGTVTGYASTEVYVPVITSFSFDALAGPTYAGTLFAVRITARDQDGRVFVGYVGPAQLSDTTGTISPSSTGAFVDGVWAGDVTIAQPGTGVTITATDGGATGTSNAFDVSAALTGEAVINCWEDGHQDPVLVTTTNPSYLIDNDGFWTEYWYASGRTYPTVFAGAEEENYGLSAIRFHTFGLAHGYWEVRAKLYTNETGRDMRYYYGYSPGNPKERFVDTVGGAGGSEQHAEYSLGTVYITDGHFDLYVRDADLLSGGYPFFGWASIRLVQLPDLGPIDHIVVIPNPAVVAVGDEQQFTAQGYDAADHPIPGLPYTWSASGGGIIDSNGLFTAGSATGTFVNNVSASNSGVTGYATTEVYAPVLDHFSLDPVNGPVYVEVPFQIRITAIDQQGRTLASYDGTALLSDTTGTISPTITGSFVAGVWAGEVTIHEVANAVRITATQGSASGTSDAFDVLPLQTGEIVINCWEDDHQQPVLATTTDPASLIETDGQWTEFWYQCCRSYPTVFAAADEESYGLPVMRFHAEGFENGPYEVRAKLYTNNAGRDMRYYYGYDPAAPKAFYVDTVGGEGGTEQHAEYLLGTTTITDHTFNLYVRDADLLGGTYPFFGWATIRLTCVQRAWYADADGDGYGNPAQTVQSCLAPAGYVANSGDCDDTNGGIHPGANDVCNGLNDDCSGQVDDGGDVLCGDHNACNGQETCNGTAGCAAGQPLDCNDSNVCTTDSCDPAVGCVHVNRPDGLACNDGSVCTQTDTCQSGACVGSNPVTCTALDQCHDVGVCDPQTGVCSNPAKADGSTCNDANACTQTDTCQSGA